MFKLEPEWQKDDIVVEVSLAELEDLDELFAKVCSNISGSDFGKWLNVRVKEFADRMLVSHRIEDFDDVRETLRRAKLWVQVGTAFEQLIETMYEEEE